MGQPDGSGEDRRHREGRRVPARGERSRRRGAAPVHPLVRGGRLHGHGGPHRQHLRAPPRTQPGPAAGHGRQPSRYTADRRPLRRRLWRDGGAGSRAHAERPRLRNRGAGRDRRLDQRGGLAVFAGDGRVGRVRRGLHARSGAGDPRQQRARPDAGGRTRPHRLRRTRGRSAIGRSPPISRRISSRGRSSKPPDCRSES